MSNIPPTVSIEIDSVRPWHKNPNRHSEAHIEQLAQSYDEWSQYKNICTWRAFILCGEGFWRAAKLRGATHIEEKDFSHLSEDDAMRMAITDNESARGSEPDYSRIAAMLADARENGKGIPCIDEERGNEISPAYTAVALQRLKDMGLQPEIVR